MTMACPSSEQMPSNQLNETSFSVTNKYEPLDTTLIIWDGFF